MDLAGLEILGDLSSAELTSIAAEAAIDAELAELEDPARVRARRAELPEFELRGDEPGRHAPAAEPVEDVRELLEAAAWPLNRSCSNRYRARRWSGTRRLSAITLGLVHCTQGSTARGAAAWFANNASRGSAHVVADSIECYRTLPPSLVPWGAPGTNGRGWHLEIAGFAQWTRAQWLARRGLLDRAAYKLALNGEGRFPMRRLSRRELAVGNRGVSDHATASKVFGGTHWDPGPGFPWDVFMTLARRHEAAIAKARR
jgi:hypothetical protein